MSSNEPMARQSCVAPSLTFVSVHEVHSYVCERVKGLFPHSGAGMTNEPYTSSQRKDRPGCRQDI